ncbi:MAG: RHS repeat-associated core domain-containing protein, partial [Desulfobacteraceae bacterium]
EDGNLAFRINGSVETQYTWNAENRLSSVAPSSPASGDRKIEYSYDYLGRRIQKVISFWDGSQWVESTEKLFVYDGWNLIEEINLSGTTETSRYYVWGLDLSNSLQGAGGVGGLLAVVDGTDTYQYCYDGNGNVGQIVNAADGAIAAHYEYDPFGKFNYSSGSYADENAFKFSTKYHDTDTRLIYFGYRCYDPELGRWINRDPSGESGGVNLYVIVQNDVVNQSDYLGLRNLTTTEESYRQSFLSEAKKFDKKNPELAKALRAIASDYGALIDALPGNTTSKRVKVLNKAFSIWTDSQNIERYKIKGDTYHCSLFVNRTLWAAGINTPYEMNAGAFVNDKHKTTVGVLKIVYEIKLKDSTGKTVNTSNSKSVVTINVREPQIGDIVAQGKESAWTQNDAHVGIYLGSGVYVSATTYVGTGFSTAGYDTTTGGIGIKLLPNIENSMRDTYVYRSTDSK